MGTCVRHDDFLRLRVCLKNEIRADKYMITLYTIYTIKIVENTLSLYDRETDLQAI